MISVFGQRDINDIFGEFSKRPFPVMADMAAGRSRVDHNHITGADKTAENRLVGIGAADGPDLGVIAFEKDF